MKIIDIDSFKFNKLYSPNSDAIINAVYTSDLLSDVMANANGSTVLITIQAHKNTIAVASIMGIEAVVICNNRDVPPDVIEMAKKTGISIYVTDKNQFEVSGLFYSAMNKASS